MVAQNFMSSNHGTLVSARGHISWLDVIRKHLDKKNMKSFKASCFGHFVSIPDIQFQEQVYNLLLMNFQQSSLTCFRLSFIITEREIEFGPSEFGLITDLKFSNLHEPPSEFEFHLAFFVGRRDLIFCDIHKTFIKECTVTGGSSVNSLRLAYMYVVYGILLIRAKNTKIIDLKYIHLSSDIVKLSSYPWGWVVYEFLVRSTHRAKQILENLEKEGKNLALDANGFTIALQIWAYEVMPNLGRFCANRVPGAESRVPRILRWSATKSYRIESGGAILNIQFYCQD